MALSPELMKMVSQAKNKYAGSGGKTIKPKEGRNTYRLIAPTNAQAAWVGPTNQWWADLGVHWIKADENGKPVAVVGDCDTVYQKPSVINSAIDLAIGGALDEDSKKLYESWKARKSVLLNVIDRSTPGEDPDVLELTPTTFSKVLDLYMMYADAGQDITDPANGVDIIISRTGKGLNTNYDVAVAPSTPAAPHKPVSPDSIAKASNLHDFIASNYFRGDEQKALNFISQIAGVALPALAGPGSTGGAPRTPTAALSAPAASVPGAMVAAEAPVAPVAPVVNPNAELEARRAALLKRQQDELAALEAATAAPAPAVAPVAPAAAPVAAPAAAPVGDLSEKDMEDVLSELDNLV